MTKSRTIKLFIAVVALIFCITQIKETYAKYLESKNGDVDFTIASWHILLNNSDITDSATLSSLINPVYVNNNNIASGVIAPGSEGYFDLEINAVNTQVTFNYNISVTSSEHSDVEDLVIYGYKIDDGAMITTTSGVNNLTNTVAHDALDKVINLRIYFKWLEGEGEQMNNAADTAASVGGGTGKINVSATFTQVANT